MANKITKAPRGITLLLFIGPSIIWCSEYIGSGEVILATRNGAILGTSITWAIVAGIFLKYWIGLSGARYTVATGEGMIDMFSRIPGPKNWAVWIVLIAQTLTATIAIASIASAGGVFLNSLFHLNDYLGGWLLTLFAFSVVWSGRFNILKIVMSIFVLLIIVGVFYVTFHAFPGISALVKGLIPSKVVVPEWAIAKGIHENPWREILPLLGWGAGGFASQVWYSYWVMGAGYGMAEEKNIGQPADIQKLKSIKSDQARNIKDWTRVVRIDATIAMIIGITVTLGFALAGSGILGKAQIVPKGEQIAIELSTIFSSKWGKTGGILFMIGGAAALISSQIGQLAGWPRLLADSFRICLPKLSNRFTWKQQFRFFLVLFFASNMLIVYSLGYQPVILVKLAAILDGLLLTPLQALWLIVGLYFIMPKMFSKEIFSIIKPHWIYALGLIIAFLVFGYFCVFQIPYVL